MKKVVIIEDESIAAQKLSKLLTETDSDIQVEEILQTVEDSVEWFTTHPAPDLVFMDIQLADGLSFRIFDSTAIDSPIIFTTAYDQYALQAFKVNSIDYLLKPIGKEDLQRALSKFNTMTGYGRSDAEKDRLNALIDTLNSRSHQYQSYFLIPVKDKLVPLSVADVAFFYIEDKVSRAVTFEGKTMIIGKPLDVLVEQLDPQLFFRANRQFVVAHKAIESISIWFGGKLQLTLSVPVPERILISKARVPEFKTWFTE